MTEPTSEAATAFPPMRRTKQQLSHAEAEAILETGNTACLPPWTQTAGPMLFR